MEDSQTPRFLPLSRNATGQSLILVAFALLAVGVVTVHSATASLRESGEWFSRSDARHAIFAAMAVGVLLLAWRMDYRRLAVGPVLPWPALLLLLLACGLCGLVFVPGLGHAVGGKYRWLRVGPKAYSIGFQPSELLKIALVVFLAAWLTRPGRNVRHWSTFLGAMLVAGVAAGLVITQDFGTAVLIVASAAIAMFLAGVPWYYFAATVPPLAGAFYWLIIRTPYRLERLTAMLDPWSQSNPAAYQSQQSILAILSGGWKGVGLGNGVRKLGFLPEDHTDFIFASFCEEWGFRGAVLLMGLLLVWLLQTRRASRRAGDGFGRVLAGSLGAMIALQSLLHIGVNMVQLPPTGISLPFVSYGGTGLLLMAAATGLMVSVTAHPQPAEEKSRQAAMRELAMSAARLRAAH